MWMYNFPQQNDAGNGQYSSFFSTDAAIGNVFSPRANPPERGEDVDFESDDDNCDFDHTLPNLEEDDDDFDDEGCEPLDCEVLLRSLNLGPAAMSMFKMDTKKSPKTSFDKHRTVALSKVGDDEISVVIVAMAQFGTITSVYRRKNKYLLIEYSTEEELQSAVEKTYVPSRNISKIVLGDVNHYIFPSEVYLKRRHKNKWKAFRQRVKKKKQTMLQSQSAGAILHVSKQEPFTPSDLRNEFRLFGRIKSIYILKNGSAYIRFKTSSEALAALNSLRVNNMGFESFSVLEESEEGEYWNNYFRSKDRKQPTSPRGAPSGSSPSLTLAASPAVAAKMPPVPQSAPPQHMPSYSMPPFKAPAAGTAVQPVSPRRYSPSWGYNRAEPRPVPSTAPRSIPSSAPRSVPSYMAPRPPPPAGARPMPAPQSVPPAVARGTPAPPLVPHAAPRPIPTAVPQPVPSAPRPVAATTPRPGTTTLSATAPAWVHPSPRVYQPAVNTNGVTVGRNVNLNGAHPKPAAPTTAAPVPQKQKDDTGAPAATTKEPEQGLHVDKDAEARRWRKDNNANLLSPTSGSP